MAIRYDGYVNKSANKKSFKESSLCINLKNNINP